MTCLIESGQIIGMGFVAISTLLVVQSALDESDLGVATSSNQFARSLGGTVGIGVSGGFVLAALLLTPGVKLMKNLPYPVQLPLFLSATADGSLSQMSP